MTREYIRGSVRIVQIDPSSLPDRQNPSSAKDIHGSTARSVNVSDGSTTFILVNTLDDSYGSYNSWMHYTIRTFDHCFIPYRRTMVDVLRLEIYMECEDASSGPNAFFIMYT